MTKTVLTIAGSDPSGGAGLQNDLKTIAAHGLHGASCITVVTFQNSQGLTRVSHCLEAPVVRDQVEAVRGDVEVSSTKIGLVGNSAIAQALTQALKGAREPIVLDPVIRAGTGQALLEGDPLEVLGPLLRIATVATPNVPEAEMLSGMDIRNPRQAKEAADRILAMGPQAVTIKGGHLEEQRYTDLLVTQSISRAEPGSRITRQPIHGAGCSFSTSIACNLARGMSIEDSFVRAKRYTETAMAHAVGPGKGRCFPDPLGQIRLEAECLLLCEELAAAVGMLEGSPRFAALVPQVGVNIAVAPVGCTDIGDVVGLTGRMVRVAGRVRASGWPARGGSSHMARMAMSLRQFAPTLGCTMNIRYSPTVIDTCRELGFSMGSFDREAEPRTEKTMSWGIKRALESLPSVPDIVYDLGSVGKEPMIRILGSGPLDVVAKALRIADALA